MQLVAESSGDGGGLITDYRDVFDDDLVSDDAQRYMALEQDAQDISSFQPDFVPGLLQSAEYTDAIIRLFSPDLTPQQRDRLVALRQERQEILKRRPDSDDRFKLSVIVAEQGFLRSIGGSDVMRRQVERLTEGLTNGLSHVSFQVAPTDLVVPGVVGGPFSILRFADDQDQDVVYLEGRDSATYLETDEHVERYQAVFVKLAEECPSTEGSIALLKGVARRLI